MKRGIKDRIAIIGTGMPRFGELWEKTAEDLLVEAVYEACAEAHVDLQKDVEAAWVGTQFTFSGMSGTAAADPLRFYGKPVTRVENYCATGMDAVRNAAYAVAAGIYDIVLACGVEKLLDQGGSGLPVSSLISHPLAMGVSAPGIFAPGAVRAFKEWGWGKEDLARVAVKNHHNGARHPKAHFQREITMDMVMKSPMVCYPFGIFDCCGMSDGAAAVILTRPEIAKDLVGDGNYVLIKAISQAVNTGVPYLRPDYTGLACPSTRKAAGEAFREAGVTDPMEELDFGIVHDCFTFTELINYQDMGLCKEGEAADLIREGITAIDGKFPINPEGGLKCFGHPIGATGVRMTVELTRQVLGRADGYQIKNAKAGFAHNLGGPLSVAMVEIIATPDWEPGRR
jgi:acetyl-CoA C-acetyltransferase